MVRLVPDGKAPKAEVKTVAAVPKSGSGIVKVVGGNGAGGGGDKGGKGGR
jgi:hypothetical protein